MWILTTLTLDVRVEVPRAAMVYASLVCLLGIALAVLRTSIVYIMAYLRDYMSRGEPEIIYVQESPPPTRTTKTSPRRRTPQSAARGGKRRWRSHKRWVTLAYDPKLANHCAYDENNSDHPHPPYLQKICPQNMPYKGGLYGIKVG